MWTHQQPLGTIEVGGAPTHGVITPDGRFLYAVNSESNNVVKIDTETNTPILRIAVGSEPQDAVLFDSTDPRRWLWPAAGGGAVLLAVVGVQLWRRRRSGVDLPTSGELDTLRPEPAGAPS